MKPLILLLALSLILSGCKRNAELDEVRANLVEAQRKIDAIEAERVSRVQYELTRDSLKTADAHISVLERELQLVQKQLFTAQEQAKVQPVYVNPPLETLLVNGLTKGAYEISNNTCVYSPGSELNFGQHLQISSPTGLMISDTEQKIVGGDLNIKAKGMILEAPDGLLMTETDGSVTFIGNMLTMKFMSTKPAQGMPSDQAQPSSPGTSGINVQPRLGDRG